MSQPSWCTAAEHIGNRILCWSPRPPPHPRPGEPCISPWSVISSPCHLSPDGERPDEAVDGAVAAPVGRAVGHRAEHGAAESLWTRDTSLPLVTCHGHVSHSPMHVSGVLPAACLLLPAVLVVAQGMDSQSVVHTVSPTW